MLLTVYCVIIQKPMPPQKSEEGLIINRSSLKRGSLKEDVLCNFVKFKGKHLCQNLFFNKIADLKAITLLKKTLWHRCVPVNFAKFLGITFL